MLNTRDLNPTINSVRLSQLPQVIGEFKIGMVPCLAIVVEKTIENSFVEKALNSYLSTLNIAKFSEVVRFPVEDQLCVIVETESSSSKFQLDIPKLLTDRELQIADLVAQGLANKQIAKQLHISEWTVATHLRRIFAKLAVDSRAAMVYCCAGWIQQTRNLEMKKWNID